jgi:retron-type reverse transcriptase
MGKLRPLGILATEDKLVQVGIARILEAIYEADFLDCSYGFRPKRSCHQAVGRLDKIIMTMPVNHVIDCNIRGFSDNVSHSWMLKFLGHRISDPNVLDLWIGRVVKPRCSCPITQEVMGQLPKCRNFAGFRGLIYIKTSKTEKLQRLSDD